MWLNILFWVGIIVMCLCFVTVNILDASDKVSWCERFYLWFFERNELKKIKFIVDNVDNFQSCLIEGKKTFYFSPNENETFIMVVWQDSTYPYKTSVHVFKTTDLVNINTANMEYYAGVFSVSIEKAFGVDKLTQIKFGLL